jgi:hypothetical protein
LRSQFETNKTQIEARQKRQKQLIEKHGGTYNSGAAQAAAASGGAPLVNPFR